MPLVYFQVYINCLKDIFHSFITDNTIVFSTHKISFHINDFSSVWQTYIFSGINNVSGLSYPSKRAHMGLALLLVLQTSIQHKQHVKWIWTEQQIAKLYLHKQFCCHLFLSLVSDKHLRQFSNFCLGFRSSSCSHRHHFCHQCCWIYYQFLRWVWCDMNTAWAIKSENAKTETLT